MSVTDECLVHNRDFAQSFAGPMPLVPQRHLAVVACMDSRIDVFACLGLGLGEAHVIRNAGGVVTDDVLRSLAISQHKLQTREILVIHHTECGLQTFTDEEFKNELEASSGVRPTWEEKCFSDVDDSVRESVRVLRSSPFLVSVESVRGFVFEVTTGILREVL
ncbi:MAG: carbonic anhydrase [Acidobacteria bacterium]|nr:carbonic anhydrase [Acidobacteriota bacterium]